MSDQKITRIFIIGTGRSGTWILYRALGCHEAIHILPRETRFIIDPDGLMDLVDSLTDRYAPVKAREALFRFERFMGDYLVTPAHKPYRGFDFSNWFGGEYYWNRLESFCDELAHGEFHGHTWQQAGSDEGRIVRWAKRLDTFKSQLQGKRPSPGQHSLNAQLKTAKYFSDRSQLIQMAAGFVEDLFLHAVHEAGKQTWCEKTPQHILHMDFLTELFPQAVFIHIKRDPRGVALSLTKQPWAPSDLKSSSLLLRNVYHRWLNMKASLDWSGIRYIEMKLEDLAMTPNLYMEKIAAMCGIQNHFPNMPDIDITKVDYWRKTMSDEEYRLVNDILGTYIEEMGYAL